MLAVHAHTQNNPSLPPLPDDPIPPAPDMHNKKNLLTRDEELDLLASPCAFCGRAMSCGIDRSDSAVCYHRSNCRGTCTTCNMLKKTSSPEQFRAHAAVVGAFQVHKPQPADANDHLTYMGVQREPVAVLGADSSVLVIFPSRWAALRALGASNEAYAPVLAHAHHKLKVAVNSNGRKRFAGHLWRPSTAREYNEQPSGDEADKRVKAVLDVLREGALKVQPPDPARTHLWTPALVEALLVAAEKHGLKWVEVASEARRRGRLAVLSHSRGRPTLSSCGR